ncbi:hypothetical protein QBC44DRAFT_71335 [Cladorrhinum sp. PSN332]|nr:hypothetical protein QBC44DRAFT_71335 [Cladorrhinum sp. PSN332]
MAPLKDRGGEGVQRWMDNGPQLLQRRTLNPRQDNGNDNNGRQRFRGGNNRNNQDDEDDDENNRNNGNFRGNRGGGGNNGGDGGGNGGGGGSGSGNNNSDGSRRNGQNRGNGNGNGSGNGSGNRNGNGGGNNSNNGGNGNGNNRGNGNNNNGGNGSGRGNNNNNNNNNNNDKGDEDDDKDDNSENRGNGGGGGRNRNGDGNGDGNNRNTEPSSTASSSVEPTSSVPVPPVESPPVEPVPVEPVPAVESAPLSEPAPPPAVTAEPAPLPTDQAATPPDASAVVPNQGAVILQSALAPTPPIEGNPTATESLPLVTPTGLDGSPLTQTVENAQLSNGVLPDSLAPAPTPIPPPELLDTTGGNRDNTPNDPNVVTPPGNGNVDNSNRLEAPQGGMDPTAERVLISVGSIGAFILVCFITWMVWRTMKKSRKNGGSSVGSKSPSSNGFASMIPFFGHKKLRSMDESTITGSPPPSYREKAGSPVEPPLAGFYGREKAPLVEEVQPQAQPPQSQLRPQSQFQSQPRPQAQGQPQPQPQLQLQTQFPQQQLQAAPRGAPFDQQAMQQGGFYQQPYNPNTAYSPANTMAFATFPSISGVIPYNHQPQASFSSTNAAQFGGYILPGDPHGPGMTIMAPTTYYGQPPIAQELAVPSVPNQRKTTRSSQVSSLSSGFGDEGIIVSNSLVTPLPPAKTPARASSHYPSRFSWQSQSQAQNQRDTVYTETSEDQPLRFRSLNSWVDQQAGRIKRTQQRGYGQGTQSPVPQVHGHPGIPGIHNPPDEQSFNMMMDDEAPRRVESALPYSRIP